MTWLRDNNTHINKTEEAKIMNDKTSNKCKFTYFTDDLGEPYIIDVSQIQAITKTGAKYIDENGKTKDQSQISVGPTWFGVNTELLDLIRQLGIECN
tara:strand:+ start:366 stop:656 length:291 start_codon:yes stop_codon:yes gene_type:complete